MVIQIINILKKKYFEWRYWSNLYHHMLKQIDGKIKKEDQELIPYISKPGIALSFDDSYRVDSWYKYGKELFGYYNVKVTFNINGVHPLENNRGLTQLEIDKLIELQRNGHEIAHHGLKHQDAIKYSHEYGYEKWIEDEVETLINWIDKQEHSKIKEGFKTPISFAFPHFLYNDEIIRRIIPKYFKITRGHLNRDNLIPFNHTGFAPSICLDSYYRCNTYYLKKIIKLCKKASKNIILTCHSILPKGINDTDYDDGEKAKKWETWRVTPKLIELIINETKKMVWNFTLPQKLQMLLLLLIRDLKLVLERKLETHLQNGFQLKNYKILKN